MEEETPMNIRNLSLLALIVFFASALASCGGSDGGTSAQGEGTGRLSLSLADAPAPEYRAVYVTVTKIQVHKAGDGEGHWETILTPDATYNLLELVNGTTAALGVADLPAGTYTQMRLILDDKDADSTLNVLGHSHPFPNYLITAANEEIELKIPSGFKTGIKLVRPFDVIADRTVGLVLDFDAGRSIVKAGSSGNWLLKPTIKVLDTLNLALVTGIVSNGITPIAGAEVSAQSYDSDTGVITIVASTVTDSEGDGTGSYLMFLEPGTYNLVVIASGYATACRKITVDYNTDYTENFTLAGSVMGNVLVDLTLPLAPIGPATVDFRKEWAPSPTDPVEQILVKSQNYAESNLYTVALPDAEYLVSASYDALTLTNPFPVGIGDTVGFDFVNQL
jgi:hypothetical protein